MCANFLHCLGIKIEERLKIPFFLFEAKLKVWIFQCPPGVASVTLGHSRKDFLFGTAQVNIHDLPQLLNHAVREISHRLIISEDWLQPAEFRDNFAFPAE